MEKEKKELIAEETIQGAFEKGKSMSIPMQDVLVVPAIVENYYHTKNEIKIRLILSKEIDFDIQGQLSSLVDQWVMVAFKKQLFIEKELEILDKEIKLEVSELGGKTPSQRLRGILFILWNRKREHGLFSKPDQVRFGSFDAFYYDWMERAFNKISNTIDAL